MKLNNSNSILNGVLLLNKSKGLTSNSSLQKAKRLLGAKKAGHTGSLDPLATGMLPICFGEATKICQFLLDADKCYQTTGLLGIKTDTADATGEVIARREQVIVSLQQLQEVLTMHEGLIKQIPSMFSALKHNGTPLYRYARKGIDIERKPREVFIYNISLNDFDGLSFSLTVKCSKGTYIRNLVEDIGDTLGVGAHVTTLHREYTSGLENLPIYTLDELEKMSITQRIACLIPMDRAIDHLIQVNLLNTEVDALRQGRVVKQKICLDEGYVRLYDENAQFIGLGVQNINGDIKAKRLLSF